MGEPSSSVLQDFEQFLINKLKDLPDEARLSIVNGFHEKLNSFSSKNDGNKQDDAKQQESPTIIKKLPDNEGNEDQCNDSMQENETTVKEARGTIRTRRKTAVARRIQEKKNLKTSLAKNEKKITTRASRKLLPISSDVIDPSLEPETVECVIKIEKISDESYTPQYESILNEPAEPISEESHSLRNSEDCNSEKKFNKSKKRGRRKNPVEARRCEICDKTFNTSAYLRIHMRKHTGEKPFQCERCDRRFSQKSSLWVHMKRHDGRYDHHCTICDYKSVLKVDLVRHVAKHSGARVFICEQCGKMFTTDMRLRDHIRHVHERKETHICDKCAFSTHRADNLRRHIAVKHSDDEFFKCPVCGDMIKQRATFIVHLRRHTGERPHMCEGCGKGFKSLSQLAVHRRTHMEGMHECNECQRKFKTKHHLDRHLVVHTGVKPYSCMYCTYTCNVKGNINKHIKTVHKMQHFSFKKLNAANNSTPPISNEDAAVARGAQVTQDFLSRLSMRKDENLTVEALQKELPKPGEEVEEFPVIRIKGTNSARKVKVAQSKKAVDDSMDTSEPLHCLNAEALISQGKLIPVIELQSELQQVTVPSAIPIPLPSIECTYDSRGNEIIESELEKARNSANSTDVLFLSMKEVLGDQTITSNKADVDNISNDENDDPGTQTIYLISMSSE